MKLEKLKPGMTVYDVHKTRMGNTTMRTVGTWSVFIVSVDAERLTVTARWNGNREQKFFKNSWSKWRAEKPLMIGDGRGQYRLATREEIKAHKEKGKAAL